jgi:hypothetical protein
MNRDSREYDILGEAAWMIRDIDGLTCEIGVREGGGTKVILDMTIASGRPKVHIAIDPFGNIEYQHWEDRIERIDYTNKMKNRMLQNLYGYCSQTGAECLFFPLEDTEFFKRYADGVPIYDNYKRIENKYALVFFDGPHTTELVKNEFNFFKDKIPVGGVLVFDDIDQYPHMERLDEYIQSYGFQIVRKGSCKLSYKRIEDIHH